MKINDSNLEVIVDLAYAYESKGDMMKAIEYNNLLLDFNPYSFDGWVNIGRLYTMNGQYDKAIDSFDFALTIVEDDLPIMKMKGMALYMNDNVDESIALFRKCLTISPNDDAIYDSLFEAYEVMGLYDEMMYLIDMREKNIGSEGIIILRAFAYLRKGDFETARTYFSQIPDEEKESLKYYLIEGELAFIDKDYETAEAAYLKAALMSEEDEEIINRLSTISVAKEDYSKAAEYLEEVLKISPEFPTAKARLAFIRFEIGSKEPFDDIVQHLTDDELRFLLSLILESDENNFDNLSRDKILTRLNEARESNVLFKNIKY